RTAGQDFGAVTINGTGTWALKDRLSLPGGALTLTSGTLNTGGYTVRAGSVTKTSGTLTSTSSTLVLDGTTNTTLPATTAGALRVEDPSENNLVGYWKLDNAQGTTFRDYSGNGNTGTLFTGASWVTSSLPSIGFDDPAAISLDGSTGYASAGATNLPAIDGALTVSFWAYWPSVSAVSSTPGQNMVVLDSSGTHLQIGLWHDQTLAMWNNGGNNMLNASSTPSSGWHHIAYTSDGTTRKFYLDGGTPTTSTAAVYGGTTTTVYLGTYNGANEFFNGKLDDIRVYNTALNAAQIASLAAGRYPGTGGTATLTLGGAVTVDGALALDSGSLSTSTFNLTASNSGSTLATVSAGTLTIGSGTVSLKGGATFQSTGTLTMATSGGTLAMGSGTTLTIDGTLNASSTGATINSGGGASTYYTFTVGSTASATPTVNISGLAVQNTNGGMAIGATIAALPVVTRFDNIAFSGGTGTQLLSIKAATLYLQSNGCTFDNSATYAVTMAGNGTGSGAGPRALFGSATCATNTSGICATSQKSDDDGNNDGVADHPSTNGAVVQFVRAAPYTAGTLVGFPTAAFDWNTFAYYSTYAAFHNASAGTNDMIYILDEAGAPITSWTDTTAGETITGTPQWVTPVSGGTHYVYVSVNGSSSNTGKVYRLIDTGTGSAGRLTVDSSWASSGAYSCSCTITSGLSMDASNLYWAATTASAQVLAGIKQSNGAVISASWPVTTPANVTTSSPTLVTQSGTTTLYLGVTADLLQLAVTGTTFVQNTKPGTITGRVSVGTSLLSSTTGTQRAYAGDSAGTLWAISPSNFTGTNYLWSYAAGSGITNNTYDSFTDTVQFGTSGGKVVVLTGAGSGTAGVTLNTTYPVTLDASDPITAAPLYYSGVLVVGTTKGKLYFLDRNTGLSSPNGVSTLATYSFGPTESVSTIAFDPDLSRYMVSTSSTASDGRIYYFDLVADQTASFK
ncbi:MAG: LamG-like jellyroll fold domain-containing protein, partial [Verrucomicrobiota bacterium]